MKNMKNVFGLALVASCGLAMPVLAQVTETEPNETKANADAVGVINLPAADGPALTGTTTGTSTTVPGPASADTFRVVTAPMAPGIWRNRLVITTAGTAGHVGTIRGLAQTSVGTINPASDNAAQTSATATVPSRFNQWYTFGPSAEMYYRVTGTTTTTSPYDVAYEVSPVTPIVVPDLITAGAVTITETGGIDADYWVYDSNFNPIPGFGIDTSEVTGVTRLTAPGTYYLAMSRFNGANNLASAAPETFAGTVLDFPGAWVGGGSTNTTATATPVFNSSSGPVTAVTSNLANYEVAWYQFTVTAATTPSVGSVTVSPNSGPVGTNAVVVASVFAGPNPISTVSVDASAIDGGTVSLNDSGVAPDVQANDNNWSGTVTVGAAASIGAQTLVVTATDTGSLTATGNGTFTVQPPPPACASGIVTASFSDMISTIAVSTAIPPVPQPGSATTNTIVQSTQTAPGTATAMRITGRYIETNVADIQTENRIRIVSPSGISYLAIPFPTGPDTNPRDLTNFLVSFTTAETIAGDWYFESGQSFNDSGEDGRWSTICFAWANPPIGTPTTPLTAFAGNALPGFGSDVNFSINVAGGTGPYTVTVDGTGAAGIGSVSLLDGDNNGSYTATVAATSFSGPGAFTLPYLITDSLGETFAGNIVVNIRRGVTDLGEVSVANEGDLVTNADLATGEIRWFRFTTCVDTAAPSFFDVVTSGVISGGTNPNDTEVGFYRADGTMLANDDDDGVLAGSALSFGAGSGATQGGAGTLDTSPVLANGRDGATSLIAGEYYMAIGHFNVTFGATAFNVTTAGTGSGTVNATLDTDLTCGPVCNDIDFNNDGSLFDPQDIDAFLSVYSEGPCIPDTQVCDDIDFNNDTSVFDPCDIASFLQVYAEGACELCPV